MNSRKTLILTLLFSLNTYYCFGQHYGVGLLPEFSNFYGARFMGFDTTGLSQGKEPEYLYSSRFSFPKLTPTFIKRYQNGKRMVDFYIGGRYAKYDLLNARDWSSKPTDFYKETLTNKKLYFSSTVHARLWASKEERFAFWLGLSRTIFWESTVRENVDKQNFLSVDKTVNFGLSFSLIPTLQYRLNQKLFFYLKYRNPSFVSVGILRDSYNEFKKPPLFISNIEMYLFYPKFTDNFQLGVRYFFKDTQKKEEIELNPKKRPVLSKTYWGVGAAINISPSTFGLNESSVFYKRYEFSSIRWNFSPAFCIYKISDFGKRYQELYFSGAHFTRDKSGIPHFYTTGDSLVFTHVPGTETYYKFILGYAYNKRVEKLSKGFFNFYLGTNIDYTHISYRAAPSDKNVGFKQSQRTDGLRVSVTPSILWNIGERFSIETKWRPHFFIESALESYHSDNPLDKERIDVQQGWQNYSNIALLPSFQLGVKYVLKVIKPKKIRNKKN